LKTILVVDNDLGFVAYLCSTLTKAGYTAVPSTNVNRAIPLLKELNIAVVDAVVMNLDIPGSAELARELGTPQIIALEGASVNEVGGIPIAGTLLRAQEVSEAVEAEWLQTLKTVLRGS
jgi:hypothetical protein